MESTYKVFYEKRNGDWQITEVREEDIDEPPTHYEQLKDLEWLVGEWVDADEDVKIESVSSWDKYKNFITQKFTVIVLGHVELEGKQIIAWDPANERIRSWVFDSDGGFGEGSWMKKGDRWVVEAAHTLADGRRSSAINIYTKVDRNSYTWESTGRDMDGEFLPDIDPVKVIRKKG